MLLGGLAAGLAWGIDARLWMRFVSTSPEFSWTGTLFIVVGFGTAGLAQSAAYVGRRANLRRPALTVLRVVAVIGLLPLGGAAGLSMLPAIIIATLALTHREWPWGLRSVLGVAAMLPAVANARSFFHDLSVERAVVGVIWFLAIYAGIIWAARFSLGPQLDGWRAPTLVRLLGAIALALVTLLGAQIALQLWSNA